MKMWGQCKKRGNGDVSAEYPAKLESYPYFVFGILDESFDKAMGIYSFF